MPEIDLGKVVGPQGKQGAVGPEGPQGIQGVPGNDAMINGYRAIYLEGGGGTRVEQEGDTTRVISSSPNLLDNWYFADPIDQRAGYVVPPDTPYYSDTGLTTQAGTVNAYTTATYVNGTYSTITVDSVTYYVAWTAAVRGYTSNGYTIDRWRTNSASKVALVTESGIIFPAGPNVSYFYQLFDDPISNGIRGKTVTLSVLTTKGLASVTVDIPDTGQVDTAAVEVPGIRHWIDIYSLSGRIMVRFVQSSATLPEAPATIVAAKLELGSVQTLAHQDADGSWVLNDPPPDKGTELAKCQRYQWISSNIFASVAYPPVIASVSGAETDDCRFTLQNFLYPTTLRANPEIRNLIAHDLSSWPVTKTNCSVKTVYGTPDGIRQLLINESNFIAGHTYGLLFIADANL